MDNKDLHVNTKRYIVTIYEGHCHEFEVEATDKEDAIDRVLDGKGENINYYRILIDEGKYAPHAIEEGVTNE